MCILFLRSSPSSTSTFLFISFFSFLAHHFTFSPRYFSFSLFFLKGAQMILKFNHVIKEYESQNFELNNFPSVGMLKGRISDVGTVHRFLCCLIVCIHVWVRLILYVRTSVLRCNLYATRENCKLILRMIYSSGERLL